jgi:hypothetical protein
MPATAESETPVAGTDGRVIDRTNGIILAGVQTWRRMGTTTAIKFLHFESAANAAGTVHSTKYKGQADNKVRVTGVCMKGGSAGAGGTHAYLDNGVAVSLDLMVSKTSSLGYQGVIGLVSNFELGHDINDKLAEFSCEVEVSGVFPTYGTVAAIA